SAAGDGDAEFIEDLLGLVLVDLHRGQGRASGGMGLVADRGRKEAGGRRRACADGPKGFEIRGSDLICRRGATRDPLTAEEKKQAVNVETLRGAHFRVIYKCRYIEQRQLYRRRERKMIDFMSGFADVTHKVMETELL